MSPDWEVPIRRFILIVAALAALLIVPRVLASPPTSHHLSAAQKKLRDATFRSDYCLAQIVDHENGTWDPTVDFGGGHGNVYESYGLVQANPGTKMVSAGKDWRTNPVTQLRWGRMYSAKYGGTCAAWAFWQSHRYW